MRWSIRAALAWAGFGRIPSIEDDLRALQGRWQWHPKFTARADIFWFSFEGPTISFSSDGPAATLPEADSVPFEIKRAKRERFLELDDEKAPAGVGRKIGYRFDGELLVLTIDHEDRPETKEYKLVRWKRGPLAYWPSEGLIED